MTDERKGPDGQLLPGYSGRLNDRFLTIAEVLKPVGFPTAFRRSAPRQRRFAFQRECSHSDRRSSTADQNRRLPEEDACANGKSHSPVEINRLHLDRQRSRNQENRLAKWKKRYACDKGGFLREKKRSNFQKEQLIRWKKRSVNPKG